MDLEDIDMEFDWTQVDIPPSLLNNPANAPQQVNVHSVQDSVGTKIASSNHAPNTRHTFDFPKEANSSNKGNPQELAFDHYELPPLPDSLAPSLDETQPSCYVPSTEGLIPEGAGSWVPDQDMMALMNCYNQFPMMHDLGRLTQQSNQLLVPNIESNQNLNGVNQSSLMFGFNNHTINPSGAWNSPRSLWMKDQGNDYNALLPKPGFQQHNFTTSALNSAILGLSGTRFSEGLSSQIFNNQEPQIPSLLSRHERAPGVQLQQVPLFSVNTFPTRWADNGLVISSFRAQPSAPSQNMLNQNDRSTVTSCTPYTTFQQNSSLNSQEQRQGQRETPRRGRPRKQFEPAAAYSFKRGKKGWSARENVRKTPLSKSNQTPDSVTKKDQNQQNSSSTETASLFVNAMYDPAFERAGVPIDPLLRLWNTTSEKPAGPAAT